MNSIHDMLQWHNNSISLKSSKLQKNYSTDSMSLQNLVFAQASESNNNAYSVKRFHTSVTAFWGVCVWVLFL